LQREWCRKWCRSAADRVVGAVLHNPKVSVSATQRDTFALPCTSAYSPPLPEGFVSPMTWGSVDNIVERFVTAGVPEGKISCEPDTFVFDDPVPPSEFLGLFRSYYGPTMNAFQAAETSGHADQLHREFDLLFNEQT
jgi:hypothetical protein